MNRKNSKNESLRAELLLDARYICLVDSGCVGQVALLLRRLLRQDVTLESVLPLDFSRSSKLEALLGACFGLHLRHGL